ncbi:MAG: ADP-heptose--LPS heptosyltransferase [Caulobacteraceae bacterium]|nr:MAG: ADP-heptose--LPS heptosyltransferase [Caulobacteraceae bacterium]
MKAIRDHHPAARITLLTTPPFEAMARATGWFDEVWTDGRPSWGNLAAVARLIGRIRKGRFSRVYDLQTQGRTVRYFQLLWPGRPPWSGNAPGAAFAYGGPERDRLHVQDSQREQLRRAGIEAVGPPDIGWLTGKGTLSPPEPFALLVPGGAPHRPAKRWPAARYGDLARALAEQGITPLVLGHGPEEAAIAAAIQGIEPRAQVLVGQTSFGDIADLARRAALVVGNDTGPAHIAIAAGAPGVVLFSAESNPSLSAPRPIRIDQPVEILRRDDLADLDLAAVLDAVKRVRP